MKIAVGGFAQESHSFSPVPGSWDHFGPQEILRGPAPRQKGPGFHGAVVSRGVTGVLVIGHIYLVVMERPCRQWDPELYRSLGLEPRDAQIMIVKSPAAFRAAYGPFAAEILIVDVTGVASPNLRALPFKHVRRPLYPLDEA